MTDSAEPPTHVCPYPHPEVDYDVGKLRDKFGAEKIDWWLKVYQGDWVKVCQSFHGVSEISHFTMAYKQHTKFVLEENPHFSVIMSDGSVILYSDLPEPELEPEQVDT